MLDVKMTESYLSRLMLVIALVTCMSLVPLSYSDYPPPLKQIRDGGVDPDDVQCNAGLVHAVRTNGDHVCVKETTAGSLGWEIFVAQDAPADGAAAGDDAKGAQEQKEIRRQAGTSSILSEYRQSTLDLINEERAAAGVPLLKLGANAAAQQHAENMLANCFSGHWGVDGLKPHMRYTLAGGQQYSAENVMGLDYCFAWDDGYQAVDLETAPADAVQEFMDSEGHREAMLDPHNRLVNVGMAYDTYNIMTVHQFEYGHMQFHGEPSITNGVLELSGRMADGVRLDLYEMLPGGVLSDSSVVTIYYDPPPSNLTRGQLAHTYSACTGEYVATIMPPLPDPGADWYWESTEPYFDTWTEVQPKCTEPRDVPADAVAPVADWDAERVYRESKWASMKYESVTYNVWYKHAERWDGGNERFDIRADISPLLQRYGPGVYTVTLWGTGDDGTDVTVSDYALFYKTKD